MSLQNIANMNNLKKLTEGMKFAYIVKKYNELIPEIYPELKGRKYRKMTIYRFKCLFELSVSEVEIFCKLLRIEPKELLTNIKSYREIN